MSYSHECDDTVVDHHGRLIADFRKSDSERTHDADHLDGIRRGLAGFAAEALTLLETIANGRSTSPNGSISLYHLRLV